MGEENQEVELELDLETEETQEDDSTNENVGSSEAAVDPVEEKARSMGWKPKEDFEGEPSDWVSYETFVAKQPLFEKIQLQNKQLSKQERAIRALQEHNKKVEEAAYDRAIRELKAERRTARRDDDDDRLDQIDDQILELQEKKVQVKTAPVEDVSSEITATVWNEWRDKNDWYNTDLEMQRDADLFGQKYMSLGLPQEELLQRVERDIKKLHSDKFVNPNRNLPSGVTKNSSTTKNGSGTPNKGSDSFEKNLTSEERKAMKDIVDTGIMSKADYLKDLKQIKGVE